MGHEIASVVTGLQEATEGLAEVCAHMLGQFWASMQGMRGAGGAACNHWGGDSTDEK